MSRSGLPGTIFVRLATPGNDVPCIIGTDAIYYVDGRYSRETIISDIERRYRDYLKRGFELLGYSTLGDYTGKIHAL